MSLGRKPKPIDFLDLCRHHSKVCSAGQRLFKRGHTFEEMFRKIWTWCCAHGARRGWCEITTTTGEAGFRPRIIRHAVVEMDGRARSQPQLQFEFRRVEMPRNTVITRDLGDLWTTPICVTPDLCELFRRAAHHHRARDWCAIESDGDKRGCVPHVLAINHRTRELCPRVCEVLL